jgi:hypothetical protein
MMTRSQLFLLAILLFTAVLAVAAAYLFARLRRAVDTTWETLLSRLNQVNRANIALVALDLVDENGVPRERDWPELEPEQIRTLIGGMEGLEVLGHNCEVLVDLAFYVQQWYPEALLAAEDLRRNAREILFHIERLQGAARTGNLDAAFADYAQRAATTYYLMTRHLIALYEAANSPHLAALQATL